MALCSKDFKTTVLNLYYKKRLRKKETQMKRKLGQQEQQKCYQKKEKQNHIKHKKIVSWF